MSGGMDRLTTPDNDLSGSYEMLSQITPLILEHQGKGTMSAVLLNPDDPPQKIRVGNYTLEVSYSGPRRAGPGAASSEPPRRAAAIFIATGPERILHGWLWRKRHFYSEHPGRASSDWPPWKKALL